jgi:4'-phosphopantetheinyl transferase EntD
VGYFAALLDPRIAIAEAPLSGASEDIVARLPDEEAQSIANAVPRRRIEFAMGRECARDAMASLGHARQPLPRGHDRQPVWPDELVGSITHTGSWAAAAVARREAGFAAIGIDLEPANELAADLWSTICSTEEQAKLSVISGMTPGLAAHLLFCMKEAAFKCQFPLSQAMLDFSDFAIDIDVAAGKFSAIFQRDVAPFHANDRLSGRFAISKEHVASAVVITSERAP